jgi:SAM-dependent methyltransferase
MVVKKDSLELFLISFLALFLELAIIRWLSTEVRIFAYFKNLPLMAAFLGFGVGCYLHKRSDRLFYFWFPIIFACLVLVITLAPIIGITHVIFVDPRQYFLLGTGLGDHATQSAPSLYQTIKALSVIICLYFMVMAVFATLCSKLGELINRTAPLTGYSINVLGSLCGVGLFSLVSFLRWPPGFWLIIVFASLSYFHLGRRSLWWVSGYFLIAVGTTTFVGVRFPALWSPYYKVMVQADRPLGIPIFHILVNYDGFQMIQPFAPQFAGRVREADRGLYNRHYDLPFRLSKRPVESVLILGGGTGNDAAVALRNGAKRVDVVEIDPVIAELGKELHADQPYQSNAVHLFIDDARSFLQRNKSKYDLVIFATLDSHTAFSSLSSLRLDNFVFTEESLLQVADHLKPGGGVAINFFAINSWLSQRHYDTLKRAMGIDPIVLGSKRMQETILLAGALFDATRDLGHTDYAPLALPFTADRVESSTDDWPFLFLEGRGIPFTYLLPLILLFVLSLIPFRYCLGAGEGIDWHLFFMGAAFLLIETKAVTALGLIFGSTWLLNSIVIGAIMVMILAANFLAPKISRASFASLYGMLSLALVLNFVFPLDTLNQLDWVSRIVAGGMLVTCPLFVAALIFAKAFAKVGSSSAGLASNLFGALVGGLLEYLDMWTGLRWLNLIALALYLLSFWFLTRSRRAAVVSSPKLSAQVGSPG